MYPPGEHPLYPYTREERMEVLKAVNIKETELKKDVESIQEWFSKQPHLAESSIPPGAIEHSIISAKGSVEIAKQRIDNYYRHRCNTPEFFADRIKALNDPERPFFKVSITVSMPKLYKGCRVSIAKILSPDTFRIEDLIMMTFMIGDVRFLDECCLGDIWVIDVKGIAFTDFVKVNLLAMGKGAMIMHEGLGLRIFDIHVVNCGVANIGQAIINLLKHFVSRKILDRIQFHDTHEDLHKVLPKEYLCKDYGGDLPSVEEFKGKVEKFMLSEKTKEFLIDACKHVSDESKRPKSKYDENCIPGNFKKLELD